MYFVFIVYILSILLVIKESFGKFNYGLKWAFILITSISALRYGYGSDYFSYIDDFKDASQFTFFDYLAFNDAIREPCWWLLMKLFEPFGYYVFFAFLSIVDNFIVYRFIKENLRRKDYWIAITIYLFNFDLFTLQQSMMRQAFAMALFVAAFHYLKQINYLLYVYPNISKKRNLELKLVVNYIIKSVLLLSIMVFIHQSSIVVIPFAFLSFLSFQKGKQYSFVLFCLFILLWSTSKFISPIFDSLMAYDAIAFYGEKYINDDAMNFGIRQMLCLIPFFVSLYYLTDNKNYSYNKFLVIISMIGILVLPFARLLQLISRISYYFDIFTIVAYPLIYMHINNKIIRYSLLSLIIIIDIYMWIDKSINPIWDGSFEYYQTLFQLI